MRTELIKNRTHQSHRWKTVAASNDLDTLRQMMGKEDRIVDWNTLEIIEEGDAM